jgi:hypothetical protein
MVGRLELEHGVGGDAVERHEAAGEGEQHQRRPQLRAKAAAVRATPNSMAEPIASRAVRARVPSPAIPSAAADAPKPMPLTTTP